MSRFPAPSFVAPVLAVTATAWTWATILVGLRVAPGEVPLGGSSYHTEYLDTAWWAASGLGLAVALVAAAFSWSWGLLAVVTTTAAQWYGVTVSNQRLVDDGWGSGLEVLGYVVPIAWAILGLVAVAVSALVRWSLRRSADRRTATAASP